jgi:hypothetical protein
VKTLLVLFALLAAATITTVVLTLVFGFVPAVLGGVGIFAGLLGGLVGIFFGIVGIVIAIVGVLLVAALLLSPIWVPILAVVGIVALCRRRPQTA